MKYFYLLIVFVMIGFVTNAQNIKGKVSYSKKTLIKRFNPENKKISKEQLKKFSKIENRIIENEKNIVFTLFFNKNESSFEAEEILKKSDNPFIEGAIGPDGKGVFYNSKGKIIRRLNAYGQDFLIYKPTYNWKLKKETKTIGKYISYKAILIDSIKTRNGYKKEKIIAWYTPKINASFGPLGYSGLPGLILELERRNIKYYATKININPKEKIIIIMPSKGKRVTQEEFYDIGVGVMSDFRKNKGY